MASQLPTRDGGSYDREAGKSLGYVLIATAVLTYVPWVGGVASLTTFIVACVIVCGCCCARDYNMSPSTRGYAKGVLGAYCASFILAMIFAGLGISFVMSNTPDDDPDNWTPEEWERQYGDVWKNFSSFGIGATIVFILLLAANAMVVVFACLFTFKR